LENAVLTGTNNSYFVPEFEGCLSVKTVVRGSALWEAGGRRFKVHESGYLTLNDRQRYTLTIDSIQNATTFCLFFERGFVEDVFRATTMPVAGLLDAPQPARQLSVQFAEKLEPGDDHVMALVRDLNARIGSGLIMRREWDERFLRIGASMVWEHQNAAAAVARLPVARAATRSELYRRLLRGRDFLLSSLDARVRLKEVAREACLSPYHFHRAFRQVFGETPHNVPAAAAAQARGFPAATQRPECNRSLPRDRIRKPTFVQHSVSPALRRGAARFSTRRFAMHPKGFGMHTNERRSQDSQD